MERIDKSAVGVLNDALVQLRQDAPLAEGDLFGETPSVVGRKCLACYESCRMEVLLARDWDFAVRQVAIGSFQDGVTGKWISTAPCEKKIKTLHGCDGSVVQGWDLMADGLLVADDEFVSVTVVEDVADVSSWPSLVRRALVFALARDLAIPITGRQKDLETMNALYVDKLKQAALHDARQNNVGPDAWGRNVYADRIRGVFRDNGRVSR